ncbi:hypothetical protein DXA14_16055 [Hungatella hathewayi]|nr:hypothetical protein DXA14_16055 [Hungatella hathewayi]
MEKESHELEKEVAKEVDTFNNHWGTGHFLGPNTLRYEENREVMRKKTANSCLFPVLTFIQAAHG